MKVIAFLLLFLLTYHKVRVIIKIEYYGYIRFSERVMKVKKTFVSTLLCTLITAVLCTAFCLSAAAVSVRPVSSDKVSLNLEERVTARVKASLQLEAVRSNKTTEYGFIVTRLALLEHHGVALDDFYDGCIDRIVKGISRGEINGETINEHFQIGEDGLYFAALMRNLNSEFYDETLVARPYVVYDGNTYYGDVIMVNVIDLIWSYKNNEEYYNSLDDYKRSRVDEIINLYYGTVAERIKDRVVIPVNDSEYPIRKAFDTRLGQDVYYICAWIENELKYIPVCDDCYPRIVDDEYVTEAYCEKICTYEYKDGIYHLNPVTGFESRYSGEYIGMEREDMSGLDTYNKNHLFYFEEEFVTASVGDDGKVSFDCFDRELEVDEETVIVVSCHDRDQERTVYFSCDAETFFDEVSQSGTKNFDKASVVVANNPDSKTCEFAEIIYIYCEEFINLPSSQPDGTIQDSIQIDTPFDVAENLIIPTTLDGEKPARWVFNKELGKDVYYIYAHVDGRERYIPISYEDCLPEIINPEADDEITVEYEDKLCTYTIEDNLYVIKSLGYDVDNETEEYIGIEKQDKTVLETENENAMFYMEEAEIELSCLDGVYSCEQTGSFELYDCTKIILLLYHEECGEYHFHTFDAESFVQKDMTLSDVSLVLSNNINSLQSEYLTALFARGVAEELGVSVPEGVHEKGKYIEDSVNIDSILEFSENLIIPTTLNGEKPVRYVFDESTGKDTYYVYAYVDSSCRYVPLANDGDSYPAIIDFGDLTSQYHDKLCVYTIKDNKYVIKSLGYDLDNESEEYIGIEKENMAVLDTDNESAMFYSEGDAECFKKVEEKVFDLGIERMAELCDYTRIIIRGYDYYDEGYIFQEFDSSSFTKSLNFDSITFFSCVLVNNPNSNSCEKMGLVYAICDDEVRFDEPERIMHDRIVSYGKTVSEPNNVWRSVYNVYNPYTGQMEYSVPSIFTARNEHYCEILDTGMIASVRNGYVEEDESYAYAGGLSWLYGYDKETGIVNVAPENALTDGGCIWCMNNALCNHEDKNKNIFGEDFEGEAVRITDDTCISVISGDKEFFFNWGQMSRVSLEEFETVAERLLCYGIDADGNKRHAPFIKAYVSFDTRSDEEYPEAEYIVIAVYDGETVFEGDECDEHKSQSNVSYSGQYSVVATNSYCFNSGDEEYSPLGDALGENTLFVTALDEDAPFERMYFTSDELNLEMDADSYIMSTLNIEYIYDLVGGVPHFKEVVSCIGDVPRVLVTDEAQVHYREPNRSEDLYWDWASGIPDNTNPKAKGYITVDGKDIYFFDAPEGYIDVDLSVLDGIEDEFEREEAEYILRNSGNVKVIGKRLIDAEEGLYEYYVDYACMTDTAEEIIVNLNRLYSGGLYRLEFYDVNGDGVQDYMMYKSMTYGFADDDETKTFSLDMQKNTPVMTEEADSEWDAGFVPTIYTNGAQLSGKDFDNGDMIIAYVSPEENLIEVYDVIEPETGLVTGFNLPHGRISVGEKELCAAYSYRLLEGFFDGNENNYRNYNSDRLMFKKHLYANASAFPRLMSHSLMNYTVDVYTVSALGLENLIYYDFREDIERYSPVTVSDICIPVTDADNMYETRTYSMYDANDDKTYYYLTCYDGTENMDVAIDVDNMYPKMEMEGGEYLLCSAMGIYGYYAYADKLCTFEKTEDGLYRLLPLLHAEDCYGNYIGINRDSSVLVSGEEGKLYGNDFGYETYAVINKLSDNTFELLDESAGETLLGDIYSVDGYTVENFTMTDSSRIIIKNRVTDNDEYAVEYLEYDMDSISSCMDSPLINVQFVLSSTEERDTAELVILYGEAEDFALDNDGIRIISSDEAVDEALGKYRAVYEVYNPYSGKREENCFGKKLFDTPEDVSHNFCRYSVVKVKAGFVDEVICDFGAAEAVWISDYDEQNGTFNVTPVSYTEGVTCPSCFDEILADRQAVYCEGLLGEPIENAVFALDEDTAVSLISHYNQDTLLRWGTTSPEDSTALASLEQKYLCYNSKAQDDNANYYTEYARYLKAYVSTEGNFVIIVAHDDEETASTELCIDHLPPAPPTLENPPELIEKLERGKKQLNAIRISKAKSKEARKLVVQCLTSILEDAARGQYIDKNYVRENYRELVDRVKTIVKDEMYESERSNFSNLLMKNIDDDVQDFILDYFDINISI